MLGEVGPLQALRSVRRRRAIIDRIIAEYPTRVLAANELFYRIRINPTLPSDPGQYDSPPERFVGCGRLDAKGQPVLYGSQDLEVCIHECRVAAEDDTFVATLRPKHDLRLLNLSALLKEREPVTEFESLDMAVHMLFLAGRHSYRVSRAIAEAVRLSGFDGLVFPSYFSLLRLGHMPFETVYGISHRRIAQLQEREQSKTIPNLALFGRPVATKDVEVTCIDRVIIERVGYEYHFGPAGTDAAFAEE